MKSNAKDVETGEFNEMSLLDFLSEKNQRSNSVDQTIADHHESSKVNNSSSFAVNTTRRTQTVALKFLIVIIHFRVLGRVVFHGKERHHWVSKIHPKNNILILQ